MHSDAFKYLKTGGEDRRPTSHAKMQSVIARYIGPLLAIWAALTAVSVFGQTALIEQGYAAIFRGDSDAAIAVLEQAIAQYPNSAEAHYALFTAYGSKAEKINIFSAIKYAPKAKTEGEKAVALNPKYVEARLGLIEFYIHAPRVVGGSQDKAFEQAKAIKAIDPVVGHRAYGVIYAQQKKRDLAKKEYIEAIREQPNSAKAHTYFGQYFENVEKNYPAASAEFEAAVKMDPNHMAAWYHLGKTAALANSNLPRGEEALKKYIAYTPRANEPSPASAHYFLGAVYEKEGKKAEAKQSYQTALKLNPTHKQATEALKRVS